MTKRAIYCENCKCSISLNSGLSPNILFQSVNLQVKSLGCQIVCDNCGEMFFLNESPKLISNGEDGWRRFC